MDTRSKKEIKAMITKDMSDIHNRSLEVKKFINDQLDDTLDYLRSLAAAIPQSVPGPSTTRTSKVLKERDYHRKETIPEDDIINIDNTVTDSAAHDKTENKDAKTEDVVETTVGRTKRKASIKAAINIEKQLSTSLVTKLRRLTLDDDSNANRKRGSRPKETKIADTVIAPTGNYIEELSMCEDALEIFTPLMNSTTMDIDSTYTQKMMNATVILEPSSPIKLNETVVINKNLASSTMALQEKMQLTEDESSTEIKKSKANIKKQEIKKRQKRQNRSMTSSEHAILNTPTKPSSEEKNTSTGFQEMRNKYKSKALFNPYIKVSVKKRIEAFEQAGVNAPKLVVDVDAPTRITPTKTREQNTRVAAQTEASENANIAKKAIAHKLARKLVAKAKKILLAKENKDVGERRKQKEQQQRLQRLQNQDEAQRTLAEQRRREQEAERRKEAELRTQGQAADEVMKTKHQMITSQPQYGSKQQGPTTYVLDGEPDDDKSGDESRPLSHCVRPSH